MYTVPIYINIIIYIILAVSVHFVDRKKGHLLYDSNYDQFVIGTRY